MVPKFGEEKYYVEPAFGGSTIEKTRDINFTALQKEALGIQRA